MSLPERFWWVMTICAVVWYLTITVYVSIKGAFDIRQMLRRLEEQHNRDKDAAG